MYFGGQNLPGSREVTGICHKRTLSSLTEITKKSSNSAINCEAFASFSVEIGLSLCCILPNNFDMVCELEASWPRLDLVFNNFNQLSEISVDRILSVAKPTTCLLDPCPS